MRVRMRMPSKKQYNLVTNDELDTRVPLHPEEAFTHGIKFNAKYIGTLDVPRPTSRVEIVAAMRRIRYEFKAKGIKKKKIALEISVDGVKISLRKKKKQALTNPDQLVVMSHPIYRIFYVSHDSQDLKIFSYIARDAASNVFKCHVFKANKKNQAMKVVRTVGQAFEVVHKMAARDKSPSPDPQQEDALSRDGSEDSSDKPKKELSSRAFPSSDGLDSESGQEDLMTLTSDTFNDEGLPEAPHQRTPQLDPLSPPPVGSKVAKKTAGETFSSPLSEPLAPGDFLPQAGTPLSVHHELQLLGEQLEQQQQQTQAAVAQVHLLRDQLAAETAARLEAQARTHQLLVHNKELLEHIQQLVLQVRDLELKLQGGGGGGAGGPTIPMVPSLPESKAEDPPQIHPAPRDPVQKESDEDPKKEGGGGQHQHQQGGGPSAPAPSTSLPPMYVDRRLTQVPEDGVAMMSFGALSIGGQGSLGPPQRGAFNGPITRAASERYSRQETLAQMQRMAWARHTTK